MIGLTVVADNEALIERFAETLLDEYVAGKGAGRAKVVYIVPVGPVGQFQRFAALARERQVDLGDLVLINMDEYLTPAGEFIPESDALSFRRHMRDRFYSLLHCALPEEQRIFPDPHDPANVTRAIERWGGVDVCFGGVGITGHLAFNDPPEPGEEITAEAFAALPTRIVTLSRETVLINSVSAARGNIDRIPRRAVTVGMKEILAARKVRLFMNREWQAAIIRKLLHGPVTASVPASLLQHHVDAHVTATELVMQEPEPQLR